MSLDFLLERVVKCVEEREAATATVVVEARGRREDEQVCAEYEQLLVRGTQFVSAERFGRALEPGLGLSKKREGVAGLELAYLCAAPRHQDPEPRNSVSDVGGHSGQDLGWLRVA